MFKSVKDTVRFDINNKQRCDIYYEKETEFQRHKLSNYASYNVHTKTKRCGNFVNNRVP